MNQLNIIGHRKWYYLFSGVLIVPGTIALLLWGLNLGIDFKGGSQLEVQFKKPVAAAEVKSVLDALGLHDNSIQTSSNNTVTMSTRSLNVPVATGDNPVSAPITSPVAQGSTGVNEKLLIEDRLTAKFGTLTEVSFDSVGPVIGQELTRNAIYAVLVASLAIVLYIGWAFRAVPKPASSLRFGVCAIIALLHDMLFLLGSFALLGKFFNVQANAMFVVAALTVMGFSVHDSIVVFDRIRESLRKERNVSFEEIVNRSILETLGRSINTTVTVLFTLLALFLFGGDSIRIFTLALLLGITSGSYSSIFNASPLLVDWQNFATRKRKA